MNNTKISICRVSILILFFVLFFYALQYCLEVKNSKSNVVYFSSQNKPLDKLTEFIKIPDDKFKCNFFAPKSKYKLLNHYNDEAETLKLLLSKIHFQFCEEINPWALSSWEIHIKMVNDFFVIKLCYDNYYELAQVFHYNITKHSSTDDNLKFDITNKYPYLAEQIKFYPPELYNLLLKIGWFDE